MNKALVTALLWAGIGLAAFLTAPNEDIGMTIAFICFAISNVWSAVGWLERKQRNV